MVERFEFDYEEGGDDDEGDGGVEGGDDGDFVEC